MTTTAAKPLTAEDLMGALRVRYGAPEYVLLTGVRDGTGAAGRRWADALAMGVWPSRGLQLIGLEIKVSRSDWRRERKNPDKAEPIALYCDRWYVVAPAGVVPIEEIPAAWGLLELRGDRLAVAVEALVPLAPKPVDRPFLASLLRCAVSQAELPGKKDLEVARREGIEIGERSAKSDVEIAERKRKTLQGAVDEFERASGAHISEWNAGEVGYAVGLLVKRGGLGSAAATFRRIGTEVATLGERLAAALAELEAGKN